MDEPQDKPQPLNRLKLPEGIASTGPVMDITEAYVRAVIALPEILQNLTVEIGEINDAVSLLALCAERKGKQEGLISDEDLRDEEEDVGKGPAIP